MKMPIVGIQPHVPKADIDSVLKWLKKAIDLIEGLPSLNWMDSEEKGQAASLIEKAIEELEE